MPNRCSFEGCTKRIFENRQEISYHSFPTYDSKVYRQWMRFVNRKDFVPSKSSKLCSLHFSKSDFISSSQDTNDRRSNRKLKNRYLRKGAIPSKYPEANTRPTVASTSSARLTRESQRLDQMTKDFLNNENIEGITLVEVYNKLITTTKPSGYQILLLNDALLIFSLNVDEEHRPKILTSMTILPDSSFTVICHSSFLFKP